MVNLGDVWHFGIVIISSILSRVVVREIILLAVGNIQLTIANQVFNNKKMAAPYKSLVSRLE